MFTLIWEECLLDKNTSVVPFYWVLGDSAGSKNVPICSVKKILPDYGRMNDILMFSVDLL